MVWESAQPKAKLICRAVTAQPFAKDENSKQIFVEVHQKLNQKNGRLKYCPAGHKSHVRGIFVWRVEVEFPHIAK